MAAKNSTNTSAPANRYRVFEIRSDGSGLRQVTPDNQPDVDNFDAAYLPDGKILIPGVITHHTITVEHPRVVADRILRYAGIVGRENVIAGADCGFAQADFVERTHPSVMWAKFDSLVEGARIASRELWG